MILTKIQFNISVIPWSSRWLSMAGQLDQCKKWDPLPGRKKWWYPGFTVGGKPGNGKLVKPINFWIPNIAIGKIMKKSSSSTTIALLYGFQVCHHPPHPKSLKSQVFRELLFLVTTTSSTWTSVWFKEALQWMTLNLGPAAVAAI